MKEENEKHLSIVDEYLSTRQLCKRIHYKTGTINNLVSAGTLIEGIHFYKPGGKNRLWRWLAVRQWIERRQPNHAGSTSKIGKMAA